ncbi:hypothetical protein WMO40_09870 [Bacillaceae bacterium CLA-AA-H227]|uniref:Uncharacterized protein n=1 Tax=Robertmurraya yapensis (ex Hitch et al 2024) TaxID=3133160 RepID=A0ACC6SAI8_9BACI|nr:hypothetical protein [Bacillus yapensis]
MKKDPTKDFVYFYDEQGTDQVSEQIMNAYNSGVIDQPDGQFDMSQFPTAEETE